MRMWWLRNMAIDVPGQFKFQHIISHTFPGFFSAITLFMLLDIFSPLNLTSFILTKGIDGLIAFAGFVILIGTILGIIIDGIHHYFIEGIIFENNSTISNRINQRKYLIMQYWKIKNENKKIGYPDSNIINFCDECLNFDKMGHCPHGKNNKTRPCPLEKYSLCGEYYLYKDMSDKFINIYDYLIDNMYSYSEFYANTFLSLIPFSIVAPMYAYLFLKASGVFVILASLLISVLAYSCIKNSLLEYSCFHGALNGVLRSYVDPLLPNSKSQAVGSCSFIPSSYSITGQVEIKNMEFIKKV
jgi:hypothetical protein